MIRRRGVLEHALCRVAATALLASSLTVLSVSAAPIGAQAQSAPPSTTNPYFICGTGAAASMAVTHGSHDGGFLKMGETWATLWVDPGAVLSFPANRPRRALPQQLRRGEAAFGDSQRHRARRCSDRLSAA